MSARVSIIMGIYNCEKTLSEAIDSILSQTYPHWKLIMCNDGSTDSTMEIAKRYQTQEPERIVVIENERNMGLNFTLNHCLKYADTEYVARMDGDDLSLPERLEKEVQFLDEHPEYAIVSTPMIYFDEHGDWGHGSAVECPEKEQFVAGTPFCHAPCMVRKSAYEAVGGYSTEIRTMRAEDYDLWFRMYAKGFKGYNLQIPLYKMRDDESAYHRRKFKFSINEAYVRWRGYKMLSLPLNKRIYAVRPILVALLPRKVYMYFHHMKKSAQR